MIRIKGQRFSIDDFKLLLNQSQRIQVSVDIRDKIMHCHKEFQEMLKSGKMIYGVNTGFGALSQEKIDERDQNQLQLNLVRSHAAGMGDPFDYGVTRTILLLKLINLSFGYSGVRWEVVRQLRDFLNEDILPVIPSKGSVGASGDLIPLSHMALALIGEGEVHFSDRILPSMVVLREVGLEPLVLQPKEALSLINGTQASTALGILALIRMERVLKAADCVGAMSVEATLSSRETFHPTIHRLKKHRGQFQSATNVWRILQGSEIVASHSDCEIVQDPYSFRCIPHVHGASRELYFCAKRIIENEINSVSDNPIFFPRKRQIATSGHFHAEIVGQAMDVLSIAAAEVGAISERRIFRIMEGIEGKIPRFLAGDPGLESGFMMAQVTAASLASENKTQAFPASVDSIPTQSNQEDFVSMALWAGRKLLRIVENVIRILGIELLVATHMIDLHRPLRPSPATQAMRLLVRRHVRFSREDRVLSPEIDKAVDLVGTGKIISSVESKVRLE
ncbi:MAG: histidine ammonia-lyase [Candidatus Neomarinimicrobiota bacterium]